MLLSARKKLLFCLALVATCALVAAKKDDSDGAFVKLKSRYRDLSPKGKFVTGATVGFVGSRLALTTVTKVIKVGAGIFVA